MSGMSLNGGGGPAGQMRIAKKRSKCGAGGQRPWKETSTLDLGQVKLELGMEGNGKIGLRERLREVGEAGSNEPLKRSAVRSAQLE